MRLHLRHILYGRTGDRFNPFNVQRALTVEGVVWAFRDARSVCIAQGDRGSVACVNADRIAREGLALGTFTPPSKQVPRPHSFVIIGLVPDQIHQALVAVGKQREILPVQNNLFSASSDSPILLKRLERSRQP
jgi:hypothetical protein